jgi:LPS-assembly lipoprotein
MQYLTKLPHSPQRRTSLALLSWAALAGNLAVAAGVAGCGFKLRGAQSFAFNSMLVMSPGATSLVQELQRGLEDNAVKVVNDAKLQATVQVVLDVLSEQREKSVVGVTSSGQVRELQLRLRVKFRLRTATGKDLIEETELLQQRDISFNETAALSKEAEEVQLYRSMQTDMVQQLLRRLAAVRAL